MRFYRSKRFVIILGAVGVTTASVWLYVTATNVEAPLRPWQSLFTALTKPTGAILPTSAAKTEERAEPAPRPEVSPVATTLPPNPTPLLTSAPVASPPENLEPEVEPQVSQSVALPGSAFVQTQVEGTRIMYMAHASLRVPEVADPHSATNRQILQSMVSKAFFRSQQAKP